MDHQDLFERVAEVHNRRDWEALATVFTEDYVEEYPQSGEVIRGLENAVAVRASYPGGIPAEGIDLESTRMAASDEQWVVSPMFSVVKVQGSGTVGTAAFRVRYPDGSTWWNVNLYEVRGQRIARNVAFFAPVFDPPEWRRPYTEGSTQGRVSDRDRAPIVDMTDAQDHSRG